MVFTSRSFSFKYTKILSGFQFGYWFPDSRTQARNVQSGNQKNRTDRISFFGRVPWSRHIDSLKSLWRYENAFDSRPTNPTFTTTICTIAKIQVCFLAGIKTLKKNGWRVWVGRLTVERAGRWKMSMMQTIWLQRSKLLTTKLTLRQWDLWCWYFLLVAPFCYNATRRKRKQKYPKKTAS